MKKAAFQLYFGGLLFIFFIASCLGQSDSKVSTKPIKQSKSPIKIGTQIADYVVEIYEDKKGNIWFGTMERGVARYIPADLRKANEEPLSYFSTKEGLCGNTIPSIVEDKDGNIWFGSHTGLCKYDLSTAKPIGKETITEMWSTSGFHDQGEGWMGVRTDRNGNIWAYNSQSVFQYDGISFSEFKLPIDKEKITSYAITPGNASFKLEDKKGNLWFGTDGYGAFKYDPSAAKAGEDAFTHFTKKDGLCSNNITNILEDKNGNIWFTCMQSFQPETTDDGGVCRLDSSNFGKNSGNIFTKFPDIKGFNNNDIYTIYEGKSGNIWICATGVGLYRYDFKNFTLFDKTDRPYLTRHFGIQSILEDSNGTFWCGFSGGLFKFDGEQFLNVKREDLE